jgi:hypothetical protein
MKYRSLASTNWVVYHKNMSATPQNGYLNLNGTAAFAALTDSWNNTAPTSSVITMGAGVGSSGSTNYSVQTSVAYCFAEIPGYSKFGSYLGNAAPNGPFIYTGFRPRFIIIKETTSARGWIMFDTSRSPNNIVDNYIFAEVANAAASLNLIDILSNGFKTRATNLNVNGTPSANFIYMAFAENPFNYSLAR